MCGPTQTSANGAGTTAQRRHTVCQPTCLLASGCTVTHTMQSSLGCAHTPNTHTIHTHTRHSAKLAHVQYTRTHARASLARQALAQHSFTICLHTVYKHLLATMFDHSPSLVGSGFGGSHVRGVADDEGVKMGNSDAGLGRVLDRSGVWPL